VPEGTHVLAFALEHHANLLPWRRRTQVHYLPIPDSPDAALSQLDAALAAVPAGSGLVAVTGASNVTGEVWPLAQIVELAHRREARVLIDAAQLAPHFQLDLQQIDADYVAFSGHKMYAPFGAGALVGRPDWLRDAPPFLFGGGAVDFVTLEGVRWASLPDRQEAGSPNVIGAVALGVACQVLSTYGMDRLADEESNLAAYARDRISRVPGIERYTLWSDPSIPRLGILTFNLAGYQHSHVAAVLSAEYAVGVRHGCFCAHPYLQRLLRCDDARRTEIGREIAAGRKGKVPGAVRLSIGLGTTREDIDDAAEALETIARHGARWSYRLDEESGEYLPDPDPRQYPDLRLALHVLAGGGGESS
jgi:selenocysteine lyase/cysteine desulfurase